MADNPTTEQINAQNESIQNLTQTQATYREETSRTAKETEAFYKKSVRGLANVVRSATGLKNALKPTIREVDALSTAVTDVNTATLALAKTQKMAARDGKIQMLAHIQDIKGVLKSYEATTIQMQKLNAELNNSTAQYKKTSEELDAVKVSIANLEKAKKKGTITTEEYDREIKKLNDDAKVLDDTLENLRGQIEVSANSYAKKQKQLIQDRKNIIESARASREANREVRMQTGGMGAFRAALEGVADSKFWDMAEKWSKGGLLIIGLKEMYDALNGAAKHMGSIAKLSNQIDSSLGRAGEQAKGFGDLWSDSHNLMKESARTAGELGMKLEEVTGIADQVRLKIRIDKGLQLDAKAVTGLTKEIAYFSKITGIDASTATDMLNFRMKELGMSAFEASADLKNTRAVLGQMTVGLKNNNLLMDDMVGLINDASAASSSYTVDTRLLTQSLRAAANQSLLLSTNQKLAKDTAGAMGKVLSAAGEEWINVPWGNKMAKALREEGEDFIKKYPPQVRDMLRNIRADMLKKGGMGDWQAGKLLIEQIGATAEAAEYKWDQVKHVLETPIAPTLVKKVFQLESESAAKILIDQYKKANKLMQTGFTFGEKSLLLTDFMNDRTESINKTLKDKLTIEEKIKFLEESGMSNKQAGVYLKTLEDQEKELEQLAKDRKAAGDSEIEIMSKVEQKREYYRVQQVKFGKHAFDPITQAKDELADIFKNAKKKVEIDVEGEWTAKELLAKMEEAGYTKEEAIDKLIKTYDINTDRGREEFDKSIKDNAKLSANALAAYKADSQKYNKEAEERMQKAWNKFDDGFFSGIESLIMAKFPILSTDTGKLITSGLKAGVGAILLGMGTKRLFQWGVFAGLKQYGAARGPGGSGTDLTSELATAAGAGKYGKLISGIHTLGKGLGAIAMYKTFDKFSSGEVKFKSGDTVGNVKAAFELTKGVAGGLAQLKGPVGVLASTFLVGVGAGEALNKVFEQLGWTGEQTIDSMISWMEKSDGWFAGAARGLTNLVTGSDIKSPQQMKEDLIIMRHNKRVRDRRKALEKSPVPKSLNKVSDSLDNISQSLDKSLVPKALGTSPSESLMNTINASPTAATIKPTLGATNEMASNNLKMTFGPDSSTSGSDRVSVTMEGLKSFVLAPYNRERANAAT